MINIFQKRRTKREQLEKETEYLLGYFYLGNEFVFRGIKVYCMGSRRNGTTNVLVDILLPNGEYVYDLDARMIIANP
jgi:hypothetical protein